MLIEDLNTVIRETLTKIIKLGHSPGQIARLLLSFNGPVALSEFMRHTDPREFGLKPLTRIGDVLGYQLKLVYVKEDNHELNETLDNVNLLFADDMVCQLITYIDTHSGIEGDNASKISSKRQAELINNLLESL